MGLDERVNLPALLSAFRKGDKEAFSQVFNHFYQPLCYFGQRIIGDGAGTEDIVQDVFVKLWKKHTDFDNIDSLKSFLYVSVRNSCFNFLDSNVVKLKHQSYVAASVGDEQTTILHSLIRAEVLRQVFDAVETLPEQCRKVIKMTFEEGKKPKEIAEELGITISTVNNQKMRGISLLKDRLPNDQLTLGISILVPTALSHLM